MEDACKTFKIVLKTEAAKFYGEKQDLRLLTADISILLVAGIVKKPYHLV